MFNKISLNLKSSQLGLFFLVKHFDFVFSMTFLFLDFHFILILFTLRIAQQNCSNPNCFNPKQDFFQSSVHQCFLPNVSLQIFSPPVFHHVVSLLTHQTSTVVSVSPSLLHRPVTKAQQTLCRAQVL